MKQNRKGFTLAELLIVVAIIGVLVAIAIPIFTAQLERSRESTDLANVRSMYAEIMASAIGEEETFRQGDGTYQAVYQPLKQKEDGWTTDVENMAIGGVPSEQWVGEPKANGSCTVTYNPDTNTVTISWDGSGGGGGSGDDPVDPGDNPSGTTPAEANTTKVGEIADAIHQMMAGEHAGTHVNVEIRPDGTISSIKITGPKTNLQEGDVLAAMQSFISDNKVNLMSGDDADYYEIIIKKNEGGNPENEVSVVRHHS